MRTRSAPIALALGMAAAAANAQATTYAQIVSGVVMADSTHPLAGVVASVTMAPDRVSKQDTINADGRWRLRFEHASGDYLVHIAAPGHEAFRKRVTAENPRVGTRVGNTHGCRSGAHCAGISEPRGLRGPQSAQRASGGV